MEECYFIIFLKDPLYFNKDYISKEYPIKDYVFNKDIVHVYLFVVDVDTTECIIYLVRIFDIDILYNLFLKTPSTDVCFYAINIRLKVRRLKYYNF